MGKFSLLSHFHHFWQAYLQMVNRHIKIKSLQQALTKKMTKICTKIAVTQGCGEFRWV
jgi:hypothetical protein